MWIGINEELAKIGHTRESVFVLLDLAIPRSELAAATLQRGDPTYTIYKDNTPYLILGRVRFAVEDAIVKHLGIAIGIAEKLAFEYLVLRGYAVPNPWEKGGRYHEPQSQAARA